MRRKIAASLEEHGMYRLIHDEANPQIVRGWTCRCGVECRSDDQKERERARLEHRVDELMKVMT